MAEPGTVGGGDGPEHGFDAIESIEDLKILMHPLRLRAYVEAITDAVSAKDLASRLEVPLPRMSYHVRLLADAGMLRVVRRTPRRGALETHYRARTTLDVSNAAMERGGPEIGRLWARATVDLLCEDIAHAIEGGASAEPDFLVARAHFTVDDAGRRRMHDELLAMYDRLAALEEELRVPAGEGAHELNVVLVDHAGRRAGGRNGPVMIIPDADEREAIPPE